MMNHSVHWLQSRWYALGRAMVLSAAIASAGCGARTQNEVGGKTSWLAACDRDADCSTLDGATCVQNLCTVECENTGCGDVEGTRCAAKLDGCLEVAACLPRCTEPSDCRNFGASYGCIEGACVLDSCLAILAPDGAASDTRGSSAGASSDTSNEAQSSAALSSATPSETTSPADSSTAMSSGTDGGGTQMTGTCEPVLSFAPSQRPYATELAELTLATLEGEPACEGVCGYYSRYTADEEIEWSHTQMLDCPLDTSECGELQAALDVSPPRCNTVDDCLSYSRSLDLCEPAFDSPRYFDSALFTAQERAAREAIFVSMLQRGCRRLRAEWDGPMAEVGCIDNECQLVLGDHCNAPPPSDCDACAPDAGP